MTLPSEGILNEGGRVEDAEYGGGHLSGRYFRHYKKNTCRVDFLVKYTSESIPYKKPTSQNNTIMKCCGKIIMQGGKMNNNA